MRRGLTTQRLLALFIAGGLLFNFPLLGLFDKDTRLFGLPLLPAALFIVWALLIAVLAWLLESSGDDDGGDADPGPGAD
jgi:hypothetical protein